MSEQILNPVEAISAEIESSISTQTVGMLRLKKANATIVEAARRPNPRDLYHGLWYEGEVCCLFADSNLGKSIYAVQMADAIAREQNVLYMDCELSDKQFQLRYYDVENNIRHIFPDGLIRAEIDPEAISMDNYEDTIKNEDGGNNHASYNGANWFYCRTCFSYSGVMANRSWRNWTTNWVTDATSIKAADNKPTQNTGSWYRYDKTNRSPGSNGAPTFFDFRYSFGIQHNGTGFGLVYLDYILEGNTNTRHCYLIPVRDMN